VAVGEVQAGAEVGGGERSGCVGGVCDSGHLSCL